MISNCHMQRHCFFIPAESLCNRPGNCIGIFLSDQQTASASECLKVCQDFPGVDIDRDGDLDSCNWYTFNSLSGDCKLWEGCLDVDTRCSTCVTGNVGCIAESTLGNFCCLRVENKNLK